MVNFITIGKGGVEISGYIPGVRLGRKTRLDGDTRPGSSGAGYHRTVVLELDGKVGVDISTVKAIINAQKPAYTVYSLRIRQTGGRQWDNDGS